MKKYIDKIKEISDLGLEILLPDAQAQLKKLENESIEFIERNKFVKIPIMGLFNAGKTSLINALLGQPGLLPVDITPTTAIPCEIYSIDEATQEKAEIYRNGQLVYDGTIEGYSRFEIIPGDLGKIYVACPFIHACQQRGIIFVDMPGSDSGIREHNEAIIRYVKNGTIFVLLCSASKGSLSVVETAFLNELAQYGLSCALFLSKVDLLPAESIDSVTEVFSLRFRHIMGQNSEVGTISAADGNVAAFTEWIESINVDDINKRRFTPTVKKYFDSVNTALTIYRGVVYSDINFDDIDSRIDALKQQLVEIDNTLTNALTNADSPEKSTQDILDAVQSAMIAQSRLVAQAIMSESSECVNDTIMSIIRPALMTALANEREQFLSVMKTELDAVTNRLLENIDISSDVIIDMITENSDSIVGYLQALADRLMQSDNPYVAIAGQILNAFAEDIPDLVCRLFGGQEKALKKVEQKFLGPFTSQILSSLHPLVLKQVREQQKRILEDVRAKYAQQVGQIKELLKKLYDERAAGQLDLDVRLKAIDEIQEKISVVGQTIY